MICNVTWSRSKPVAELGVEPEYLNASPRPCIPLLWLLSLPPLLIEGSPDYRGEKNLQLGKGWQIFFEKNTHINRHTAFINHSGVEKNCNIQVHRTNSNLLFIYTTECLDILVRNLAIKHWHLRQACLFNIRHLILINFFLRFHTMFLI